jgi:enoyl-CoA hydratase/carnithine racemase
MVPNMNAILGPAPRRCARESDSKIVRAHRAYKKHRRAMSAEEGERWGFHNRIVQRETLLDDAQALARSLASGPTFAHGITKTQLNQEWNASLETAIEMEAQAQAICMATNDFRRAFEAFAAKKTPEFKGD